MAGVSIDADAARIFQSQAMSKFVFSPNFNSRFLLKVRVICGCLIVVCLGSFEAVAEPGKKIRKIPYPFSHVVSFASDVDLQRPWHGAAIHREFNQGLGLTVSDSLWPQGGNGSSSFFLGYNTLNRAPSGVGTIPVYGLTLREWHRGNVDHFHSWQEDGVYQVRNDIKPPVQLIKTRTTYNLPKAPDSITYQTPQNIRLYFSEKPPPELRIMLTDNDRAQISLRGNPNSVGEYSEFDTETLGWFAEFIIPVKSHNPIRLAVNSMKLTQVDLIAPSCAKGCSAKLTRIERDHFSRQTVLSQSRWLKKWNVRPPLLTSHGGYSMIQNYGTNGKFLEIMPAAGTLNSKIGIVLKRESLAGRKNSHAYHTDILKELSVVSVWPYFVTKVEDNYRNELPEREFPTFPVFSTEHEGVYNAIRSTIIYLDISSADGFVKTMKVQAPEVPSKIAKTLYCGTACNASQGDALSFLLANSLYSIKNGYKVMHFWYTHFGSGGSKFKPSTMNPITSNTLHWMRQLADSVFNYSGTIPNQNRIWSPPAGSWIRYQLTMSAIEQNTRVFPENSRVEITPWIDPVTNLEVPDPLAGSRDLHGVTVYVPYPERAKIWMRDKEITTFVKNPLDATGKPSITIVDDNSPTTIIGKVPLNYRGKVEIESGEFTDTSSENSFISLKVDASGIAKIVFHPNDLSLWNTSHVNFKIRKRTSSQTASGSSSFRFQINFVMKDGGVVSLVEAGNPNENPASSRWVIPPVSVNKDWQRVTLSVAQLDWPDIERRIKGWSRPPLPIGPVDRIEIEIVNAEASGQLDLADFRALRPSGNGEARDGSKLVAGRVTHDGSRPLSNILVRAETETGLAFSTVTNSEGYYFFYNQKRGEILKITAKIAGEICSPQKGIQIEIQQNEAEIDIRTDRCG